VPVLSRAESDNPSLRMNAMASRLVAEGVLAGELRIPNAVSPPRVTADLRASKVTCSFEIDAPRERRALTRVNWLLRQLKAAPATTRVEALAARSRVATAELLRDLRDSPAKLVGDPSKELRTFTIARTFPMGSKRGSGR